MPTPPALEGTDEQRLEAFRQTLLAIRRRLELLVHLPPEKLAQQLIQHTARDLAGKA